MNELVLMAPTQLKLEQGIGNIYSLTLIDFYVKTRRLQGHTVNAPFIFNVNGRPLSQLVQESKLPQTETIDLSIRENIKQLEKYSINFFDRISTDHTISRDLEQILLKSPSLQEDTLQVMICQKCNNLFGTDPSIQTCKYCNNQTRLMERKTLFQTIKREEVQEKINIITWIPSSLKERVLDFVISMPQVYPLVLEKEREYTLNYKNYALDPRFIALMNLEMLSTEENYDRITLIHGDVVKKLDYYLLSSFQKENLPTQIIAHGSLLDSQKKKFRWRDKHSYQGALEKNSPKALRCHFLRYNAFRGMTFDPSKLDQELIYPTRMYVKIKKMLESHLIFSESICLDEEKTVFFEKVNKFEFPMAFKMFEKIVDKLWRKTKFKGLSFQEKIILDDLTNLYYGGKDGIKI